MKNIIPLILLISLFSCKEETKPESFNIIIESDSLLYKFNVQEIQCDSSYYFIHKLPFDKLKTKDNKIYASLDGHNFAEIQKDKFDKIPVGYNKCLSSIKPGIINLMYCYDNGSIFSFLIIN